MLQRSRFSLLLVLRQFFLVFGLTAAVGFITDVAAPGVAFAKKKKRKKKKKKKAKAAAKKVEAPPAAKAEEKKKDDPFARSGAASFKVETDLDKKQVARTQQADKKRDEAIEELKKLIPKAPSGRKAEMIFRLAELYWEKSKYKYGLEMDTYEKSYNEWADAGQRGDPPKIKDFLRKSELIKQNALKLYEKVMTEYPTYERNDEVLFYLGYNEYEAGNKAKAVSHYWTLIKQFPKSRLVPDAYLQLGEHFFTDNNVIKARKAFERALAADAPRIYNYALYKLAWCDYNIQEYAAGIKKLKDVISKSEQSGDKKSVQLKGEALGDLTRFFSYVDEVETAFVYFKQKGGEDIAIRYSTKLGALFHEQGKWNLEIKAYRMLIDKYPMHEKSPYLQASIVDAYSKLNKKEKVRKEVERLVDLYRPGTPWYRYQKDRGDDGKASLEYAYDLTESKLRDLVTEYHRDAQKRKDVPTYELARDIYSKYLEAFSDTDSAYELRFFYGEVLWALQEWKKAADIYTKVATMNPDKKATGKYARTAAYNAILAYEKVISVGEKGKVDRSMKVVEKKGKKGESDASRTTNIKLGGFKKGEKYEEKPIPEGELQLSQACDLYFKIADPKDDELPAIKFKAAYLYYKYNHFVAAAERYFEIIERWPGDKLSKKAANLILDSLNVQEKWDQLANYALSFRDNRKLTVGDKKFQEEVQTILEGATYLSIQTAEKKARELGDAESKEQALASVATRFSKFQKDFPDSQYSDKAIYSAVLIYNQADELDHAIEASELMKRKYEKSDLKIKNDWLLAEFYERIADFGKSAELFGAYYEDNKKDARAADALFNSGLYYQGLGDTKKAIDQFEIYTKEFKSRDDASEVYWRICELRETEKDWKKASACFDAFPKLYSKAPPERKFESVYRLALTYEKLDKRREALAKYKELVAQYPKLQKKAQEADGARLAGAHAAFELLESDWTAYKNRKVTLQKKSLLEKAKHAEQLACVDSGAAKCKPPGKYLAVLGYGNGDFGICSLTRMGQVYREMANAIRGAPMPRRLSEDQVEIYRAELDSVALGPEEKAIGAFERALAKAYELNIYNDCTLTSQSNLKELNPNKFPDLQKRKFRGAEGFIVADIRSASAMGAPAAEETDDGAGDEAPAEGDGDDEADAEAESATGARK